MVYVCKLCKKEFKTRKTHENHEKKCKTSENNEVNTIIQEIHNIDLDNNNNNNSNDNNNEVKNLPNINELIIIPKPLIKWVGGKTQILEKILKNFPKEINNYYEPFLGGGSVLIGLLVYIRENKIKVNAKINASDLNEILINLYKNIQSKPEELYNETLRLSNEYNNIEELNGERKPKVFDEALLSKESYYYWKRSEYNKLSKEDKIDIKGSSLFIFLNKTGFRGLFREGPNGFNVPFGNYKSPEIINREHLFVLNDLIKDVHFEHSNYSDILNKPFNNKDFIYLDPPYAPETKSSFVSYNEGGFNIEEHNKLFKLCNDLNKNDIKFMMSNADVELVRKNFTSAKYNIESIECKRTINSKNPDSVTKEVIIKNY